MTYQEACLYLDSLAFHGIKLGLTNTQRLMKALGDPHLSFKAIHVGGTNGKGSTCAAISSVLSVAGISNGLYTSPHQVTFRERIRINGEMIGEDQAARVITETRQALESQDDLPATYFEFMTAAAFLAFARAGVEFGVVEVGLGGRFDSTNVVDPDVSVITNVAMDHMAHLGGSLEKIAMEKLGIAKQGRPLVLGSNAVPLAAMAEEKTKSLSSALFMANRDYFAKRQGMTGSGELFTYGWRSEEPEDFEINLIGAKQVENAGAAVTVARRLKEGGVAIKEEHIRQGLKNILNPGRFEMVREKPPLIFDGAHNPAAARALSETLQERFGHGKADIIFGAMRDKDYSSMLKALAPAARSFTCFSPDVPRAEDPERLAAAQEGRAIPTKVAGGIGEILGLIKAAKKDSLTVVTGSFYTIGEIKAAMSDTAVELG